MGSPLYGGNREDISFFVKPTLKGQCHKIFCFWLFHESVFPQPQSIPLGPLQIFSKIRGDIRKSRCTSRYQQHLWQICHRCQRRRWQILPPVSLVLLIPVANLPPLSTIPAANLPQVLLVPVVHLDLRISPRICEKI
jgi:hypothetical protein